MRHPGRRFRSAPALAAYSTGTPGSAIGLDQEQPRPLAVMPGDPADHRPVLGEEQTVAVEPEDRVRIVFLVTLHKEDTGFSVYPWGLMVPDSANNRVIFLDDSNRLLQAYDVTTYSLIGQVGMTLSLPEDLIRWGEDGVAFSNNFNTTVSLIRTTLVKP